MIFVNRFQGRHAVVTGGAAGLGAGIAARVRAEGGTVEEIAAMACWLASDEASFSTGFCFDQSGGRATA